jgi:hypothetical protein
MICPEGKRKATKNISQDNWSLEWDFNPDLLKYEWKCYPLDPDAHLTIQRSVSKHFMVTILRMPCRGRLVLQLFGKITIRLMAAGITTDLLREHVYLFSYQAKARENFSTSREQTLKLNEECNSQRSTRLEYSKGVFCAVRAEMLQKTTSLEVSCKSVVREL